MLAYCRSASHHSTGAVRIAELFKAMVDTSLPCARQWDCSHILNVQVPGVSSGNVKRRDFNEQRTTGIRVIQPEARYHNSQDMEMRPER